MKSETMENCSKTRNNSCYARGGEAVYGLGIIGAIFYYFGTATTFWLFVLGFFKSVFWPAFLVYEALKFLHM